MCCSYDINVTPDKRKALIHEEQSLLEAFQKVCPFPSHMPTSEQQCFIATHLLGLLQALMRVWEPARVTLQSQQNEPQAEAASSEDSSGASDDVSHSDVSAACALPLKHPATGMCGSACLLLSGRGRGFRCGGYIKLIIARSPHPCQVQALSRIQTNARLFARLNVWLQVWLDRCPRPSGCPFKASRCHLPAKKPPLPQDKCIVELSHMHLIKGALQPGQRSR